MRPMYTFYEAISLENENREGNHHHTYYRIGLIYGNQYFKESRQAAALAEQETSEDETPAYNQFSCDGRTRCSEMTSCAEATFSLQNCPDVKMDGDHDGAACESQWCG